MRPDEHKKKRSAQYKKKHNISGKTAVARGENKSSEPAEHPKQELRNGQSPTTSGTSGSVDKRSEENERRQFSRRKVTSNWEKYEEFIASSDDDEEEKSHSVKAVRRSRGADFTTIIKKTADPSAQFRFQSEKEWEETDLKSQPAGSVLEINVGVLARSLQSVPLHRKLDLEVENIHPDVLEGFNRFAGKVVQEPCSQKLYVTEPSQVESEQVSSRHQPQRNQGVIVSSDIKDKSNYKELGFPKTTLEEFDSLTLSNSAHSVEQNVTVQQKSFNRQLHSSLKGIASSGPSVVSAAETAQSATKAKMGPAAIEDDELDMILSLDRPSGTSNQVVNSMSHDRHKAINPKKADTESATEQTQASIDCLSSQGNSQEATNQEELEDWLDSVLG